MKSDIQYNAYQKPGWSPPAWLFGPVWSVLYVLIAISYGYVTYQFFLGSIPFYILTPFILNLLFNGAFTFIQFRLKNFWLAALDILLVLGTLVWALVAVYPYAPWVSFINLPYLAWVSFATVLQVSVAVLNPRKK